MIYNAILRQYPDKIFNVFKASNLYPTSIHVLQSAVVKLTRRAKLSPGLKLYRGLSVAFPAQFYTSDPRGCRGFAEWGFMSTTSDRAVAVQYSGVEQGKASATVLEIRTSSVDRAASIQDYSQYSGEGEYLWWPLCFLESTGETRMEATSRGVITVMGLRINANLKARTCEDLLAQKKTTHITSFRSLVDDLSRQLPHIAEEGDAMARLAADAIRNYGGQKRTVQSLLDKIMYQCRLVLRRHETYPSQDFADDSVHRKLVTEMLDVKLWAVSKLRLWLEDKSQSLYYVTDKSLRIAHRELVAFLKRLIPANSSEARRGPALVVCKARGLIEDSVSEANMEGEDRLTSASADGLGAADLLLLIAAGANVKDAVSNRQCTWSHPVRASEPNRVVGHAV